jgi:hypothetical protein
MCWPARYGRFDPTTDATRMGSAEEVERWYFSGGNRFTGNEAPVGR